ncbi:hypothetical protein HQQ81_16685 [Microbacteriaceae bacterium VKM Ac-2854]|nr:hypothetical protein [Microbacteriaceae bacterium VKM Ac-2854]
MTGTTPAGPGEPQSVEPSDPKTVDPEAVDPETGTEPDGSPVENPSG